VTTPEDEQLTTTEELLAVAASTPLDVLEQRFGRAVLLGVPTADDDDHWSFQTRAVTGGRGIVQELRPLARSGVVHPVRKATKGPFADTVLVGRARSNDICIPSAGLSKLHARIKLEADGSFVISDSGSKNGTSVNGRVLRPNEQATLADGDELRFGSAAYRFYLTKRLHREANAAKPHR